MGNVFDAIAVEVGSQPHFIAQTEIVTVFIKMGLSYEKAHIMASIALVYGQAGVKEGNRQMDLAFSRAKQKERTANKRKMIEALAQCDTRGFFLCDLFKECAYQIREMKSFQNPEEAMAILKEANARNPINAGKGAGATYLESLSKTNMPMYQPALF
jgi:hypothetical protein